MAKGKHAAALFEVIHSGKDRQQDKSRLLLTPKWWFKNRPPVQTPGAVLTNDPVAQSVAATVSAPREIGSSPAPLQLNRLSNQLTFRFTYGNLIAGGCAAVILVAVPFAIGRHMSRGPVPASAGSIDQMRRGPVNRDVLNVGPGTISSNSGKVAPQSSAVDSAGGTNSETKPTTPAPPTAVAPSGKRIVGMQYVVVQTYPKEADAIAAADLLGKNGVPCSVNKGFWQPKPEWFTVVGTTGFERTRDNPDYARYLQAIGNVSKEFAAKSKFRQFEPMLVTWKDASK